MNGLPRVISAFPATGKTYAARALPGVVDFDSSGYSWKYLGPDARVRHPEWPGNYIADAVWPGNNGSHVLVSSHAEVRTALVAAQIPFALVYPEAGLREVYRHRMTARGSPAALVTKVIDELWEEALWDCRSQPGCTHYELGAGEYLLDLLAPAAT